MKTIKFSDNELEFLRNHYELELMEAENYIAEIKNILKKLGAELKAEIPETPKKKRGRPRKVKDEGTAMDKGSGKKADVKVVVKKERKKPGPKPKKKKITPKKKVAKKVAKKVVKKAAPKPAEPVSKPEISA